MKRAIFGLAAFVLLFGGSVRQTEAGFTTLDVPGSLSTTAWGISDNNVVGWYEPANGDTYGNGFLYNLLTNTYTTIDVPGSAQTAAYGVSGSSAVGYYQDGVNGPDYGFLYDGSTYTILKPTKSTQAAFASGISGNNVVGYYEDANFNYYGFLYNISTNTYTTLDPAGSTQTFVNGISGNNVVGYYHDASLVYHGFLYNLLEPIRITSCRVQCL